MILAPHMTLVMSQKPPKNNPPDNTRIHMIRFSN
jgi:hypothetical protein